MLSSLTGIGPMLSLSRRSRTARLGAILPEAAALGALVPVAGLARTIHVQSCVVTVGKFCPVETLGTVVVVWVLLAVGGVPLRALAKSRVASKLAANPDSDVYFYLQVYRYAGVITLASAGAAFAGAIYALGL